MNKEDCSRIGSIVRTNGFSGIFTALLDCSPASGFDLSKASSVFLEINGQLVPYFIKTISGEFPQYTLQFDDVLSYDEAKKLIKSPIFIESTLILRKEQITLAGEEVMGFAVNDLRVGFIGEVLDVLVYPMQILLKVNYHTKEILIPAIKPIIQKIDRRKKEISVDLPEGFLEI